MKLSDYIVKFLEDKQINYVFGYIGGSIVHLVDSIYKSKQIKFIPVYHEQTAAIAAEGYSLDSRKIGVALATSGPGATNMITGIADAYFDSIPVIYITGQVNTYEYKYNKKVRQQGFQETDIVEITKPITKFSQLIDDPNKIKYFLEKAFYVAKEGRPGPVLLDIPMNIQKEEIDVSKLEGFSPPKPTIVHGNLSHIKKMILKSKRPIILAGGGVLSSDSKESLYSFAIKNNIPIVVSLMGKGSFDETNDLFIGMIGSYGNRCANMAVSNADLLIALGTRLDTRQTGTLYNSFLREGKIIHVDIDKSELKENRLSNRININMDVNDFLSTLNSLDLNKIKINDWLNYIKDIKMKYSQEKEIEKNVINKLPYQIIEIINNYAKNDDIFCVDIGQNQMFASQHLRIKDKQKFFTSGGLAPMGYSLPAAIGASFANEKKSRIFAIMGDGGFHISLQSLMLISDYRLPIKVIVLNNETLGMICQFQDIYFNCNKYATTKQTGYSVPNIKSIAEAYNLDYYKLDRSNILDKKYLNKLFNNDKNCIIEALTGSNTLVVPKLEVNTPLEEISPKIERNRLKKDMIIKLYNKNEK